MKYIIAAIAALTFGTAASADQLSLQSTATSVAALGGLELESTSRNEWSWGAGVAGTYFNDDFDSAGAVGLKYGISENWNVNAKMSRSFSKDSYAAFVGFSGRF